MWFSIYTFTICQQTKNGGIMKQLLHITTPLILLLFSLHSVAQNAGRFVYNEKVYISTDKDFYGTNDTVRVKGFVVDSWEHKADDVSRFLYVEIINNTDDILVRRKIRQDSLGFATSIAIDSTMIAGNYYIRGYTQPMKYLSPEYIFTKHITVDNKQRQDAATEFRGEVLTTSDEYNTLFFVEGGTAIYDTPQRVVFKCSDKYGLPKSSSGVIINSKKDTVLNISTEYNGYGAFVLVPQKDISYKYIDSGGKVFPIELKNGNAAIMINRDKNILRYQINGDFSGTLFIHSHGGLISERNVSTRENTGSVDISKFKNGIICFTLNDKNLKTLSERLYYAGNYLPADYISVNHNNSNKITLQNEGEEQEGNFVISVIKNSDLDHPALKSNIYSTIMLQSDIAEPIINIDYLIKEGYNNDFINMYLITQKWDRYVKDISGFDLSFGKEKVEYLSGRVRGITAKKVMVINNNLDYVNVLNLNNEGYFYTDLPDFFGETNFFIQPATKNDKSIFSSVEIRSDMFPEVKNTIKQFASSKFTLEKTIEVGQNKYVQKAINDVSVTNHDNMWTLTLEPVVLIGKKPEPTREAAKEYYAATMLTGNDVIRYSNFNIASAVNRLLGVTVWNANMPNAAEYKVFSSRGVSILAEDRMSMAISVESFIDEQSKMKPTGCEMRVYVDGTETPTTEALRMDPSMVKSISRLTLAESSALGGAKGFCGVISIITKGQGDEGYSNPITSKGVSIDKLGCFPNLDPVFNKKFISLTKLPKQVSIKTPEEPGNYIIRLEGINNEGTPIEKTFDIKVVVP